MNNRRTWTVCLQNLATHLIINSILNFTARNPTLGKEALDTLNKQLVNKKCKNLLFYPLDISKKESITQLRDHLVEKHGGLDILVNNAGIAYKVASIAPFSEQAEKTAEVNYYGTKSACDILFPILKPHAR
uniref:Uncharacterized protein n=1 Tax=Romanomermis culicivorax TaxID=13658 RepID=A0A915ILV6_ROMCU